MPSCFRMFSGNIKVLLRAILMISSVTDLFSTSSSISRIDPLRWTSHMESCLEYLISLNERPSDSVLVTQVKMQLLTDQAAEATRNHFFSGVQHSAEVFSGFHLKSLQSQWHDLKRSIPQELQHDRTIPIP